MPHLVIQSYIPATWEVETRGPLEHRTQGDWASQQDLDSSPSTALWEGHTLNIAFVSAATGISVMAENQLVGSAMWGLGPWATVAGHHL